jgi:hypothetical protein
VLVRKGIRKEGVRRHVVFVWAELVGVGRQKVKEVPWGDREVEREKATVARLLKKSVKKLVGRCRDLPRVPLKSS